MRVTHVITRLIVGGAQENTVASVLGLARHPGLSVDLISGPTSGPEGSLESLFDGTQLLSVCPYLVRPVSPWNDWRALQWLTRRFRESAPDLVHTHSGKAGILGRWAAARAGVRMIVHTIHGPSFGTFQGRFSNFAFRMAERKASDWTTIFVTVANAMTRQYLAAGIGCPAQYRRILSGFDIEPFVRAHNDRELRARLGINPEDVVLGKIARLFTLKGHDDLLEAAARLVPEFPGLRFLLVGDGVWRQRLVEKARALGVGDNVVFVGLVPPADVARYVGIMDVLVHLSLREGLPRALPQAMAAGKPVVAYACDGAPEVCINDETGYLVAPGDIDGLTDRLRQLIRDRELRDRLGRAGQEMACRLFPVSQMVDELSRLYAEMAGTQGFVPKK